MSRLTRRAMLRGVASALPIPVGQTLVITSGNYVVPANVTKISVVCIGCGGLWDNSFTWAGGGGGLAYVNDIAVTPGETLNIDITVFAGTHGVSALRRGGTDLCSASSGLSSAFGSPVVGTGFPGGRGGVISSQNVGGGGAGGYTSAGGDGLALSSNGGGGTSPLGGTTGAGGGGSWSGSSNQDGLNYGGGAGAFGQPGPGCVRIIHGAGRSFPNTNTGDL